MLNKHNLNIRWYDRDEQYEMWINIHNVILRYAILTNITTRIEMHGNVNSNANTMIWSRSSVPTTYVSAPHLEEISTKISNTNTIHNYTFLRFGLPVLTTSSVWIYHLSLGNQTHSYWISTPVSSKPLLSVSMCITTCSLTITPTW